MTESTNQATEATRAYLYSDMSDREKHFAEIRRIAEKIDRPVSEVADVYEQILDVMERSAAVPDFLPVLVSKKVRERFRSRDRVNLAYS